MGREREIVFNKFIKQNKSYCQYYLKFNKNVLVEKIHTKCVSDNEYKNCARLESLFSNYNSIIKSNFVHPGMQ